MNEMIERVARAIEATMFAPHELPLAAELHERYRETARAAIEAMREPTEAQLSAAVPEPTHLYEGRDVEFPVAMRAAAMAERMAARQRWLDMIDAALTDPAGSDATDQRR